MVEYKYGTYGDDQFLDSTTYIRKQIFYLLLYVDPKTKDEYKDTDVNKAFNGLLYKLSGLNSLLAEPPALVSVMSMLEAALLEYQNLLKGTDFNFSKYRKLILDAGNEVLKINKTVTIYDNGDIVDKEV